MRVFTTPWLLIKLFPRILWRLPEPADSGDKVIYLTFDDGPVPEVTPFVLEELKKHQALGTFFCVGDNAVRYPKLVKDTEEAGHAHGNHTFNHLNGWKTSPAAYIENVRKCGQVIPSHLFRPPYGKLSAAQYRLLRKDYTIVLWDIVSYDFDQNISPESCLAELKARVRSGSIVVFHDSIKAMKNLREVLPAALAYWQKQGYTFGKIEGNRRGCEPL